MDRYCLDANIFIQAMEEAYAFDIAPGFWNWLGNDINQGIIYSSLRVFRELSARNDQLSLWIKDHYTKESFIEPDREVQDIFSTIADYITKKYLIHQASEFLSGADPWIIAQAKRDGAILVTQEKHVDERSKKVKIPNICDAFKVKYIRLYELLRRRNVRLN